MDPSRFDALVRSVLTTGSRRGALRRLAGGLLAAPLVGLGGREVAAACQQRGETCSDRDDCCGRRVRCRRELGCGGGGTERRRCCGVVGASCESECECCGALRCGRPDPTDTKDRCFRCKAAGEPCSGGPDGSPIDRTCCTGVCVGAGECSAKSIGCLSDGGVICSADTDCCLGQHCIVDTDGRKTCRPKTA